VPESAQASKFSANFPSFLPNFPSFLPNFSKDSFGGFVEFQWVTTAKKLFSTIPSFLPPAGVNGPWIRVRSGLGNL
jgi:hypothetical protein